MSKHPTECKELDQEREEAKKQKEAEAPTNPVRQQSLRQSLQRVQPYPRESPRCKKLDNALIEMICHDLRPGSMVDDSGFLKFVYALDQRYEPPSRRTVMRSLLPAKYETISKELKAKLSEVKYCSITTDLWTSCQTIGYITVTCHFITSEWELISVVLSTINVPGDHTADNIAEKLKNITDEWNISDKLVAAVTDNGANMVAGIRLNGWKQLPCFAHTLNLVVQDSINNDKDISAIKEKCKKIVAYFHRSSKATDRLDHILTRQNIEAKKLIQEVETRWNSTYYMLERLIKLHEPVTTTLCLLNRNDLCLSDQEVDIMKQAVEILKPFEAATREMSGDTYISVSKVIPLARSLQRLTAGVSFNLAKELTAQMNRRFANIEANYLLAVAAIVDPRYKKAAFSDLGSLETVTRRMMNEAASCTPEPEAADSQPARKKPSQLWEEFDKRVEETDTRVSVTTNATIEKQQYFQHKNLPRESNPLQWWKENSMHLPLLQELAKKYLCVPGTSVPAERVFSKAGELVTARRNALKPKSVDMVLFLNKNL